MRSGSTIYRAAPTTICRKPICAPNWTSPGVIGCLSCFTYEKRLRTPFNFWRTNGQGELGGAAHYFQGDRAYARQILDLGFHISLAKPLLRLSELQDVARWLPMDRIVLETDSYPQPFKGKRGKVDGAEGSAAGSSDGRQAKGDQCRRGRTAHYRQRAGDVR